MYDKRTIKDILPVNIPLWHTGAPIPTFVWVKGQPASIGNPLPWFNPVEGTIVLEVTANNATDSFARIVSFNRNGENNTETIEIQRNGTDVRGFVYAGSSSQVGMLRTGFTQGTQHLIAMGYKSNDCVLSIDGSAITTDALSTMPSGINRAELMSLNGTPTFSGDVSRLIYFNKKFDNTLYPVLSTRGRI